MHGGYVSHVRYFRKSRFLLLLLLSSSFLFQFLHCLFTPSFLLFFLFFVMTSAQSLTPSSFEFDTIQEAYGLTPADGVEFLAPSSLITRPSLGKLGVYLKPLMPVFAFR